MKYEKCTKDKWTPVTIGEIKSDFATAPPPVRKVCLELLARGNTVLGMDAEYRVSGWFQRMLLRYRKEK